MADYFWRVEEQGKTTLHFHLVGYFDNRQVSTDVNDPKRVPTLLKWLESNVTCHLPTVEEDATCGDRFEGLRESVLSFQRHHHPNKCQETYKSGTSAASRANKKNVRTKRSLEKRATDREAEVNEDGDDLGEDVEGEDTAVAASSLDPSVSSVFNSEAERKRFFAQQKERSMCRFGYPHPISLSTHLRTTRECQFLVRGDRDVIMKRETEEERWINPYVPAIMRIWKGNMDFQIVIEPYATLAYLLSYVTKHHRDETKWLDKCVLELEAQGNTNVRSMLFKFGNCYLTNRKIGKQLTCAILMRFPMYGFSRSCSHLVQYVLSDPKQNRNVFF
jgi:hypothetical protein